MDLHSVQLERPQTFLTPWAQADDDRIIARMLCPRCLQYTATKDVLAGQYVCPCGWRSGP